MVAFGLIEGTVTYFLNNPSKVPAEYFGAFKEYYTTVDRNIIQFQEDKARYNNDLFYTLNPGNFTFSNREFETQYSINSAGLRDKEEALKQPQLIVLGDSYAMGWGVEQDSTFSKILEDISGKRTLNAGISSYGTVRELKLLDQLDLSNLEYLIIQYCNNDYEENKSFSANNNKLNISSKEVYSEICKDAKKVNDYFFMKHTIYLGNAILLNGENQSYQPIENFLEQDNQQEEVKEKSAVELFINALTKSKKLNQIPKIILFPLDDVPYSHFVEDLRAELTQEKNKKLASKIILLDNSEILEKVDYYLLDQHIRTSGHRKVAKSLNRIISASPIATEPKYYFKETKTYPQDSTAIAQGFSMDSTIEWGPNLSFELTKEVMDSSYSTLEVEYDIRFSDTISGMLVVSVDDSSNLYWYGKKTIESYRSNLEEDWQRVSLRIPLFELKEKIKENQKVTVKVFYWNLEKETLWINNLRVGLREERAVSYRF